MEDRFSSSLPQNENGAEPRKEPPRHPRQPTSPEGRASPMYDSQSRPRKSSSKTCSVEGCGKPAHAKGRCGTHHRRWKLYGDDSIITRTPNGAPLAWLKSNAEFTGEECLFWPFGGKGRGIINATVVHGPALPARIMCVLAHGKPPTRKYQAAHSCRGGPDGCVNPRHLRWATPRENAADRINDGTDYRGEKNKQAKLTEKEVLIIRSLSGKMFQREIAEEFNVTRECISAILRGRTWPHV
jgi:hypothetical protein